MDKKRWLCSLLTCVVAAILSLNCVHDQSCQIKPMLRASKCANMPPQSDAGRTSTVSRVVYVDASFSALELVFIHAGLERWSKASGGIVVWRDVTVVPADRIRYDASPKEECVNESESDVVYVMKVWSTNGTVVRLDEETRKLNQQRELVAAAFTDKRCNGMYIGIVADRESGSLEVNAVVMTHELGHALGLDHDPNAGNSIMYPRVDLGAPCITGIDLEEFCKLHGCEYAEQP